MTDATQIWQTVQKSLRNQMTEATYTKHIQPSFLTVDDSGSVFILHVLPHSLEWLQNKLGPVITRSLQEEVKRSFTIDYQVQNGAPPPPLTETSSPPARSEQETMPERTSFQIEFARKVNFTDLWFGRKSPTGYTRIPTYWSQFWMAYLNKLRAKTFDVYLRIISEDRRNVNDPGFTHWTPARQFSLKGLGRAVGSKGGVIIIGGGTRPCWRNEANKKQIRIAEEEGGQSSLKQFSHCCGHFNPHLFTIGEDGVPKCLYWQPGILDFLYLEGLLAFRAVDNGAPRSYELYLQVWRQLPLLTPVQVSRLEEVERTLHRNWIEQFGHLQGITVERWEALDDLPSLVPLLPDYDLNPSNCPTCDENCSPDCSCKCHRGRTLWGDPTERQREFFGGTTTSSDEAGDDDETQ